MWIILEDVQWFLGMVVAFYQSYKALFSSILVLFIVLVLLVFLVWISEL